jgi:hypothetical protein
MYVATRTDPLVNTLVNIMHELGHFVLEADSSGFRLLTLTYATLMTIYCIARSLYLELFILVLFCFYIILCFGTIS